jgi:hypothetical protein
MLIKKMMIACVIALPFATAQGQNGQHFVMLPESESKAVADFYPRTGPEKVSGSWQATKADIDGLETNLFHLSELKAKNWKMDLRIDHPEKYYRQYVAILQGGQRRIFVNAFCDDGAPNPQTSSVWKQHLEIIMDGGTCVWHALYDPASGKFIDLEINGRA